MSYKLDYTDGFAIIGPKHIPKKEVITHRIDTDKIKMTYPNGDLILKEVLASELVDGSNAAIGNQDAVIAWTDANFKSASTPGGGGGSAGHLTLAIATAGTYPPGTTLTNATLIGKTVSSISVGGLIKYKDVDFTHAGDTITYPQEFSDGDTVLINYY